MGEAPQVRRPDLAQMVRRAASGGVSSITALPHQEQDFWDCEIVQNTLSEIKASIVSQFNGLGEPQCFPKDDMLSSVESAASQALQQMKTELVKSISSSVSQRLAHVRALYNSICKGYSILGLPSVFSQ